MMNLHLLFDTEGNIVTKDEVLNDFFDSDFKLLSGYPAPWAASHPREQGTGVEQKSHNPRENGQQPSTPARHMQVYGARWNKHKSTQRAAKVHNEPSSTIYQQSCLTGEVPVDWRLANGIPI